MPDEEMPVDPFDAPPADPNVDPTVETPVDTPEESAVDPPILPDPPVPDPAAPIPAPDLTPVGRPIDPSEYQAIRDIHAMSPKGINIGSLPANQRDIIARFLGIPPHRQSR